jgi:hypothetical protein
MSDDWTKARIEQRVDELKREHDGKAFVSAIKALNDEIGSGERELLHAVLLERAQETGGLDAVERRRYEGGWLRRQMRKIDDSLDRHRRDEP